MSTNAQLKTFAAGVETTVDVAQNPFALRAKYCRRAVGTDLGGFATATASP